MHMHGQYCTSCALRRKPPLCMQEQQTFHGALQSLLTVGYEADSVGPCVHQTWSLLCFVLRSHQPFHCNPGNPESLIRPGGVTYFLSDVFTLGDHSRSGLDWRRNRGAPGHCVVMREPSPPSPALRHHIRPQSSYWAQDFRAGATYQVLILGSDAQDLCISLHDGSHGALRDKLVSD